MTRSDGYYVLLIDPPFDGTCIPPNAFTVTDGGKTALAYPGSVPRTNQKIAVSNTDLGANLELKNATRLHSPPPVAVFSPPNAVVESTSSEKISTVPTSVPSDVVSYSKPAVRVSVANTPSIMSATKDTSLKPATSGFSSVHSKLIAKVSNVMPATNVFRLRSSKLSSPISSTNSSTMPATSACSVRPSGLSANLRATTSVSKSVSVGNVSLLAQTNNLNVTSARRAFSSVVNKVISSNIENSLLTHTPYTSSSCNRTVQSSSTKPVIVMSYNKKNNLVSFSTIKAALDKMPTKSVQSVSHKPAAKPEEITSIKSEQLESSTALKPTTSAFTTRIKPLQCHSDANVKLPVNSFSKSTQVAFHSNLKSSPKHMKTSANASISCDASTEVPKSNEKSTSITLDILDGKTTHVVGVKDSSTIAPKQTKPVNYSWSAHVLVDMLSHENSKITPVAGLTTESPCFASSTILRKFVNHVESSNIAEPESCHSPSDIVKSISTGMVDDDAKHEERLTGEQHSTRNQTITKLVYISSVANKASTLNSAPKTTDVIPPKLSSQTTAETNLSTYRTLSMPSARATADYIPSVMCSTKPHTVTTSPVSCPTEKQEKRPKIIYSVNFNSISSRCSSISQPLAVSGGDKTKSERRNSDTCMLPDTDLHKHNTSSVPNVIVSKRSCLQSSHTEKKYVENKEANQIRLTIRSTVGTTESSSSFVESDPDSFLLSKATVSNSILTSACSQTSAKHGTILTRTSSEVDNCPLTLKIDSVYSLADFDKTSSVEDILDKESKKVNSTNIDEDSVILPESVKKTNDNTVCSDSGSSENITDAQNQYYAAAEKVSKSHCLKTPIVEKPLKSIRKPKITKCMVPEKTNLKIVYRVGRLNSEKEKLTNESKNAKPDKLIELGTDERLIRNISDTNMHNGPSSSTKSSSETSLSNTSTHLLERVPLSAGGHEHMQSEPIQLQLVHMNNKLYLVPAFKSCGPADVLNLNSKHIARTSPQETLDLQPLSVVTPELPHNDSNSSKHPTTSQEAYSRISPTLSVIDLETKASEAVSPDIASSVISGNSRSCTDQSDIKSKKRISTTCYSSYSRKLRSQGNEPSVGVMQTDCDYRSIAEVPTIKSNNVKLGHPELRNHKSTKIITRESVKKGSNKKYVDGAGKQFNTEKHTAVMSGKGVDEGLSEKKIHTMTTVGNAVEKELKTSNTEKHTVTTTTDRKESNHQKPRIEPWKLPWNYEIKTEPVTEGYGDEHNTKTSTCVQHDVNDNLTKHIVISQKCASVCPAASTSTSAGQTPTFFLNRGSYDPISTATSDNLSSSVKENHVPFKLLKGNDGDVMESSQSRIRHLKAKLREQERMIEDLKRKNFLGI